MKPIHQSSGAMRFLCIVSILFAAAAAGMAQTNPPDNSMPGSATNAAGYSTTQTNAVGYALPDYDFDVSSMTAMSTTNVSAANTRQLSLQDCIQFALETNLDLQIDRFNPELALFTLNGAYGYYDPLLALSGGHRHNDNGTTFTSNTGVVAGSKTDDNEASGGLSGNLPWGMNYNLQASTINTFGSSGIGSNLFNFDNGVAHVLAQATQPLLKNFWIDTGRLTIRINKNRLKYSEQILRLSLMQTITAVEKAYYDLIYNRENVGVQRKAIELAERLVMENQKKLEVGALAPLDLASAQAQAAQSRAAVFAALSQLGTQERVLKGLITDEYAEWADLALVPSGTLTASHQILNRQDSWSMGLTQRPEILQARLDVEKQGIQLKFDRNQLYPQLDFVGSYGYNGSSTNVPVALDQISGRNHPIYYYGGQFSIPLANTAARNTVKSDKMTLQQLLLTLKKQEQTVMIAIDNDIGTVQADYDQVLATRAQRQYEEQALDAEQKKLENGKSTTYTVLQVQRDLTTARGAEIQALDTFNKDLSQLSLDEGSTLERLGINIQTR